MAEGLANHDLGDRFQAYSAGTEATWVNPLAIKALAELGIDISVQRSKSIEEFAGQSFDYVVTLCDAANEQCPLFFGGVQRIHQGFDDPARLNGSLEDLLPEFRRVRDEIREWLANSFGKNV
jgi:arsenate reductase